MNIRTVAVYLSSKIEMAIQEYFGGCQFEKENSFNKNESVEIEMRTFCSSE
jgi:hypothetical protein